MALLCLSSRYQNIWYAVCSYSSCPPSLALVESLFFVVDFHIDSQPPRWSSLVTFDGQRLPRWSSSSRFVVDCQPLDLPHQLLSDFAIRLSTANFLWTYLIDFSLRDLFGLACQYLNRTTPSLRRPTRSLRRLSLTLVHLFSLLCFPLPAAVSYSRRILSHNNRVENTIKQ